MPIFDITLNVYFFLLLIGLSLGFGYGARGRQLAKKQRRIVQLEWEVTEANAETLEAQREYCELEGKMKDLTNPVILMKSSKLEEPIPTPLTERDGMRKNRATGTD
jgi:hypothetical protein